MRSLTNSAQLIADYLAGKIEQSQPIQTLFQEILVLFQQESICIGPAFRNTAEESSKVSLKGGSQEKSDQKRTRRIQKDSNNNKENNNKDETNFSSNISNENRGSMPIIEGFRISCSGRLQMSPRSKPAEKAESVVLSRGVLPFNSFNQNIDFKQTYATNAYGTVGIKV